MSDIAGTFVHLSIEPGDTPPPFVMLGMRGRGPNLILLHACGAAQKAVRADLP